MEMKEILSKTRRAKPRTNQELDEALRQAKTKGEMIDILEEEVYAWEFKKDLAEKKMMTRQHMIEALVKP